MLILSCWLCGKRGIFDEQVCDECYNNYLELVNVDKERSNELRPL